MYKVGTTHPMLWVLLLVADAKLSHTSVHSHAEAVGVSELELTELKHAYRLPSGEPGRGHSRVPTLSPSQHPGMLDASELSRFQTQAASLEP